MVLTRILAGSAAALLGLCVWQWTLLAAKDVTIAKRDTDISRLETAAAERNAKIAGEREEFERSARQAEQAHRQALADAEAEYLARIEDGKRKADAVVADLRAGALRLRREWAGCETASLVSGAAASAGGTHADAELRAALAGAVIRVGADADAHAAGLQQALRACQ